MGKRQIVFNAKALEVGPKQLLKAPVFAFNH
jgi:hypothetical protein